MKRSIIACAAALALGLLSMGAIGFLLYYPAAPVLLLFFPPPDAWHGDWVWPAAIGAGMGWSFSFLAAGFLNKKLSVLALPLAVRRAVYLGVLWLGAVIIWGAILYQQT